MSNKGERFYCTYDASFLCEEFKGEFIDINGKRVKGIIAGASANIASFLVDKQTGQPNYSINKSGEDEEDWASWCKPWYATIDAEVGVIVIPAEENIKDLKRSKAIPKGYEIGYRVVSYTIDLMEKGCMIEPHYVTDETFRKMISDNFEKFNISDNFHGQNTSYGYYSIKKEYPRGSYYVGYNKNREPIIVEVPYGDKKEIVDFFTATKSEERASEYLEVLKTITPEEMLERIIKTNQARVEETINELEKNK